MASDLAVDNPRRVHDPDPEVPDASAPEVLVVQPKRWPTSMTSSRVHMCATICTFIASTVA
jgi:hypothetical protein